MFGVNAAERSAAQSISAGTTTLDDQLGMGHSLTALMMASMQLKKLQQEKDILTLKTQIQQATGMPAQQDTTVAADVSNLLRQEIAGHAAEDAPERQGGIADLDTGNLGENYNNGGIVAFTEGGDSEADKLDLENKQRLAADILVGAAGTPFTLGVDALQGIGFLGQHAARFAGFDVDKPKFNSVTGRLLRGEPLMQSPKQREQYASSISEAKEVPVGTVTGRITTAAPAADPAAPAAKVVVPKAAAPAAAALVAPKSGEFVSTPAMDAARQSITELRRQGLQGLSDLNNAEIDPATGEPIPKKTLASIATEQDTERKKALKASGLPEQGYKERITELTGQASQARNDRDVDRWLAAAQGFFAMAGGKSQYAMQNMAEGLGVGTKQLQAAEKEYRVGEKARLEGIGALKQAQRAEVLGNQKEAANAFEKYEALQQREIESKRKTAEHLLTTAGQQEQILATKEMTAQQLRDAALTRAAETRYRSAALEEAKRQAQEETKRRNEEAERQRFATFQLTAERQHKYSQKGSALDKALGDLEMVQSKLEAKGKSKDPELLTQEAALKTRIGGYNDAIANDSAAKAQRMMGAGSGWGKLTTTGDKK